jgi:multisubunit Na+/H+ antiporter MnhF subunit
MKVVVNAYTVVGLLAFGCCVYWFLLRPWRRERVVTTDGLLAIVWFGLYWSAQHAAGPR